MKNLLLVIVCISAALMSLIIPAPKGAIFFIFQGNMSFIIAFLAMVIGGDSKIVIPVVCIEISAIFTNMFFYAGGTESSIYSYYYPILYTLTALEALILITGMPWRGIFNRLSILARFVGYGRSDSYNCTQINQIPKRPS